MKRLLLDQSLPRSTGASLASAGWDAFHVARKEGLDGSGLAALLQDVWPRIESGLETGAMVTITDRSVRVRRLPILRGTS